jgi:hypothetical protein
MWRLRWSDWETVAKSQDKLLAFLRELCEAFAPFAFKSFNRKVRKDLAEAMWRIALEKWRRVSEKSG